MKTYIPPEIASLLDAVGEALPDSFGGRTALDVGCGGGIFGRMLLGKGARVTFLDVDSAALHALAESLRNQTGWMARKGEIGALPPARFHLVSFFLSLHHIRQSLDALNQAVMRTEPGGMTVVCDFMPNIGGFHRERVPHTGFDPEELLSSVCTDESLTGEIRPLPPISKEGRKFALFLLRISRKP